VKGCEDLNLMLLAAEWAEEGSGRGHREAVASGERYVDKLQEELGKRAPMFVDDANFIRCVRDDNHALRHEIRSSAVLFCL